MKNEEDEGVAKAMLAAIISQQVSQKLGTMAREVGDLTREMSEVETLKARVMVLDLMEQASQEFFTKMRDRLATQPTQGQQ